MITECVGLFIGVFVLEGFAGLYIHIYVYVYRSSRTSRDFKVPESLHMVPKALHVLAESAGYFP